MKVRAYIWQARDLPAADENGSSDPFIKICDSEKEHCTATIWDNLNPLFYEGLELTYEANTEEELPPIIVEVYDKDENLVGKDDEDFISRAILDLSKVEHAKDDEILEPIWHNLYFKTGGAVSG